MIFNQSCLYFLCSPLEPRGLGLSKGVDEFFFWILILKCIDARTAKEKFVVIVFDAWEVKS